jgi:hypothetical protein
MMYVRSIPRSSGSVPKWHKMGTGADYTPNPCNVTIMANWPRQSAEPAIEERRCLKCFPEWSNGTPGNPRSRPPDGRVPAILTAREWKAVALLVSTGMAECPWAWVKEWPKDIDSEEAQKIVDRLNQQVGK